MTQHKKISRDQFSVVIANPTNRTSIVCVNIYKDGRFNMNGKLAEKLGGKTLWLAFTQDAQHFMLKEDESHNAVAFPKNGSKKLDDVLELLNNRKVLLPAKYEVWYDEEDDSWQGDLIENPFPQQSVKPRSLRKN